MIGKSNIDTRTRFPSVHLFMLVNGPSLRDEYENMQVCTKDHKGVLFLESRLFMLTLWSR